MHNSAQLRCFENGNDDFGVEAFWIGDAARVGYFVPLNGPLNGHPPSINYKTYNFKVECFNRSAFLSYGDTIICVIQTQVMQQPNRMERLDYRWMQQLYDLSQIYVHVSYRRRMPLACQPPCIGDACQSAKMAPLLK